MPYSGSRGGTHSACFRRGEWGGWKEAKKLAFPPTFFCGKSRGCRWFHKVGRRERRPAAEARPSLSGFKRAFPQICKQKIALKSGSGISSDAPKKSRNCEVHKRIVVPDYQLLSLSPYIGRGVLQTLLQRALTSLLHLPKLTLLFCFMVRCIFYLRTRATAKVEGPVKTHFTNLTHCRLHWGEKALKKQFAVCPRWKKPNGHV